MLGENQNLTSSGGEILQKSVFKKLLISLEQTIFNFFSENLEASVQQTMKLYDLENQFSFYFVIGNLIYYGFISKNNSFDTYIKYLKAIQTKEDEMIKNKSKIFEAFSQCMLQIGTLESYYLIEKMIDLNLINENIIKNIDSLYFAHRKQIKKDSFLWKCILNRYSYFEETSKNNWELHKKLIEEGHNPNEIAKIIRNDEIEKLQEISSQNDFNFNQAIRPSVYERSSFVNNWVPLIEYAAFFGSVKCFKYLLMNGSNINNTGKYAVAGGNEEIIHLCEQNHSSFEGAYEAAIKFHRNAIFYYIYEKKLELFDKNAKQNSQSLGNIIQSNDNQLMFPLNIHGVKYRENNQNHPFFTLNDNQQKICQTINDLGCYCIMYGNYEILSFLEDEGIEGSDFLINKSASVGNLYLVKYFIKDNQFPKDILIFSSKSGNVELVKYIIEQKVIDINNKDMRLINLVYI